MSLDPRPTLLLVDDEPDILIALSDLLEDDYRILTSTSPEAALEMLREEQVAVIVSDQRMPGMTGDRFLAAARSLTDAEAILLTGYADLSAVTSALNSGGISGYAAKPWEPEALRAMIAGAAERGALRRALNREQRLLNGLMENIPAQVAFKDAAGRLVRLNSHHAAALGRTVAECLDRTDVELGGKSNLAAEAEAVATLQPVQTVEEQPGEAGSTWIETSYVPIPDAGGGLEHMVVITRDVSEQKSAEQRLRQADKLRALGTLAGGVAHDFNNLLTAILGSLDLAARRLPDEQRVRRYLDNATLAAQKGAGLTQRLLGFSRQEESQRQTIDLVASLSAMSDLLARSLGGGVQLEWRLPPGLWLISAEPDQLELAVLNLCINARDAMPEGGRIVVSARNEVRDADAADELAAGDYVRVEVADSGEGMSPEVLSRVLEPFFTTKPVGKGTGLGLPMVYGFAQRSGGGMEIESEPGQGTRVSLLLPRCQEPCDLTPQDEDLGAIAPAAPLSKVLVVDDDPAVRAVTGAFVRELGHGVIEAESGAAALALLARDIADVDLVVADFTMPEMNGLDLIRAARARAPELPAVLVTGYADLAELPQDITLLFKPFDVAGLNRAIQTARQAAPAGA